MANLDAQIAAHIEAHAGSLADAEQEALAGLMRARATARGTLTPALSDSLDRFLDAVSLGHLKRPPARTYVEHFLIHHPDHARRLFFKGARKELGPELAGDVEALFMNRLAIDLWPSLPAGDDSVASARVKEAQQQGFGESDYAAFVHRRFHRDISFPEDRDALRRVIAEASRELEAEMAAAGLGSDQRAAFADRLDSEFLAHLRAVIAQIDAGEAGGGRFHFMV